MKTGFLIGFLTQCIKKSYHKYGTLGREAINDLNIENLIAAFGFQICLFSSFEKTIIRKQIFLFNLIEIFQTADLEVFPGV